MLASLQLCHRDLGCAHAEEAVLQVSGRVGGGAAVSPGTVKGALCGPSV